MKIVLLVLSSLAAYVQSSFTQTYGVNCGRSPGHDDTDERIVNGVATPINNLPWQAGLSWDGFVCGATVISPTWVVSAAHCIKDGHNKPSVVNAARIVVGSSFAFWHAQSGTAHGVKSAIYHPDYDNPTSTKKADIAVLEVKEAFTFSDNLRPACLPNNNFCLSEDTLLTVSGWGTTSSGGDTSDTLLSVRVPVLSQATCQGLMTNEDGSAISYVSEFCAGNNNKDSCQGDSGGPAVFKHPTSKTVTLVGVVSWGYGCNVDGQPGVYVKVTNYLNWIKDTTGVIGEWIDYDAKTDSCVFDGEQLGLPSDDGETTPVDSPSPVEPEPSVDPTEVTEPVDEESEVDDSSIPNSGSGSDSFFSELEEELLNDGNPVRDGNLRTNRKNRCLVTRFIQKGSPVRISKKNWKNCDTTDPEFLTVHYIDFNADHDWAGAIYITKRKPLCITNTGGELTWQRCSGSMQQKWILSEDGAIRMVADGSFCISFPFHKFQHMPMMVTNNGECERFDDGQTDRAGPQE